MKMTFSVLSSYFCFLYMNWLSGIKAMSSTVHVQFLWLENILFHFFYRYWRIKFIGNDKRNSVIHPRRSLLLFYCYLLVHYLCIYVKHLFLNPIPDFSLESQWGQFLINPHVYDHVSYKEIVKWRFRCHIWKGKAVFMPRIDCISGQFICTCFFCCKFFSDAFLKSG